MPGGSATAPPTASPDRLTRGPEATAVASAPPSTPSQSQPERRDGPHRERAPPPVGSAANPNAAAASFRRRSRPGGSGDVGPFDRRPNDPRPFLTTYRWTMALASKRRMTTGRRSPGPKRGPRVPEAGEQLLPACRRPVRPVLPPPARPGRPARAPPGRAGRSACRGRNPAATRLRGRSAATGGQAVAELAYGHTLHSRSRS